MVDLFTCNVSGDDLSKCLHSLPGVVMNAIDVWKNERKEPPGLFVFDIHDFQTLVEMQPVLSTIQGGQAMRPIYKVIAFVMVKRKEL